MFKRNNNTSNDGGVKHRYYFTDIQYLFLVLDMKTRE